MRTFMTLFVLVAVGLSAAGATTDPTRADEARLALAAVAVKDGKPDPAIVAALSDKSPLLRGSAAEVLTRAGVASQKEAVRALLKDPEPSVRLRVGLTLARARDKEAMPV